VPHALGVVYPFDLEQRIWEGAQRPESQARQAERFAVSGRPRAWVQFEMSVRCLEGFDNVWRDMRRFAAIVVGRRQQPPPTTR